MRRSILLGGGAVAVAAAAALFVTTTGPSAVAAGAAAQVLSPLGGTVTSAAGEHTPVFPVPEAGGATGDVAMDIGASEATPVLASFEYAGEGALELTVAEVLASCSSGEGGDAVRLNVATNGTTVGSVTYAHLTGVTVTAGQVVALDAELGQVAGGLPVDESCWTGPHVHLEWVNHLDFGCYFGVAEGSAIAAKQSVGQVGGDFGDAQGIVCP